MSWVSLDKYPEVKLLDPCLSLVITSVLESVLSGISITPNPAVFIVRFHFHEIPFSIPLLSVSVYLLV